MARQGELSIPGPANKGVGKPTSGKQDQGSNVDVHNYCKVDTKGPKTVISTEFECALGKIPTGEKTGGL